MNYQETITEILRDGQEAEYTVKEIKQEIWHRTDIEFVRDVSNHYVRKAIKILVAADLVRNVSPRNTARYEWITKEDRTERARLLNL